MYFDEQDVVGESCGTQLDVDMMMAPLAASLPSFTVVPRPSFLMPLPGGAASRVDSPTTTTTTTGREGEEEALEKEEEESDAVSSLRKLLRRAGPNEDATAEPESPMARMALMDAESLAALSIVVPPSQQDTETASLNANAMQRLHLQTPRKDDGDDDGTHTDYESFVGETPGTAVSKKERRNGNGSNKRPRSSASSPASSSTSSSSTCASAVVLARKRALKESWRDRQMTVVPQQENSLVLDDEDDERAPRITSFVEYHVADIDDLVIAPSQDYFDDAYDAEGENEDEDQAKAEEEEEDSANQSTQQQQTCGFVDFRDLTQFNEECSEVFDDVIYAPKPVQSPPSMMPPIREEDPRSRSHSPSLSAAAVPLKPGSAAMKKENINSQAEKDELDENCDSESSLSDGFDIPQVTKSNEVAIPKCPEPQPHAPPPPPSQPQRQCKGQWNQRRSVKRDCTFIETQCASPVFEDDEDFEDDALALASRAGKCQRPHAVPRIEELKADYIDSSSDDFEELSMKPDDITTSTRSHNATGSPATASATRNPLRFQPRLLKKRRKARKLGLESFFRSRPCT